MGIFLGTISSFNLNKSLITLETKEQLQIGDTISIESEKGTYTISEITSKKVGNLVTIGRMKGKFKKGLKIYKMSSKTLDSIAEKSYINIENKKIPLTCKLEVHLGKPVKMTLCTINSENSFYNDINFEVASKIYPELALKSPITVERIKEQITKTSNTPYEFIDVSISMENNLYIPHIADINNLRRTCLEKLENIILDKYCHKHINLNYPSNEKLKKESPSTLEFSSIPKISILLNKLNLEYDYSLLEQIANVYIPLKYFTNPKYSKTLKNFSEKFNLYIYMPTIMRNYYIDLFTNNFKNILFSYNIKGFVISNIGNLNLIEKNIYENKIIKSYNLIGNYTLNVFNNFTINELSKLHLNKITISPELNESDFNNLQKNFNSELIIYGKIPIMNINYCPLSKRNKCLNDCSRLCLQKNIYYLKDRLGYKFEIIADCGDCITTIYNSKILSINPPKSVSSIRLDFLHEDIFEINSVIKQIATGKKLEGSIFTNGNWNRDI